MKRFTSMALVLAAITLPSALHAQACIGVPSSDRQIGVQGGMGFMEAATSYGGELNANLGGPLSLGGGYALVKPDATDATNGNSFSGRAAFELPVAGFSVCPTSGVGYTRFHEEQDGESATVSSMVVPIGVGFGRKFMATENISLTLSAVPQFLYITNKAALSGTLNMETSETDNQWGADFGVRLGMRTFYAGGGVSLTTIEDAEPTFSVGLGVLLGGNRPVRIGSR